METFRITTGARLHFGLLDTKPPFGGVGMMIDQPETVVLVQPSSSDLFDELDSGKQLYNSPGRDVRERIISIARRFCRVTERHDALKVHVSIVRRPQPHSGLGSGTQLAMAVAEGLCHVTGNCLDSPSLAVDVAGRAQRSAVGVHGYWRGGLIYELGAKSNVGGRQRLNQIAGQCGIAPSWRVVLFSPAYPSDAVWGEQEQSQFAKLPRPSSTERAGLRMIAENQLIPAAKESRFGPFAEAVFQYNHVSGRFFSRAQGGCYNGEQVSDLIKFLRGAGVQGVGQSSWGPTVFAICENLQTARQAEELGQSQGFKASIVRPLNKGREVQSDE